MTAVVRNANSATQLCGSAIAKVPTGGRKKKFSASVAASATVVASHNRPNADVARTTRRRASAAVVELTVGSSRPTATIPTIVSKPATSTATTRDRTLRGDIWPIIVTSGDGDQGTSGLDFLRTLYGFLTGASVTVTFEGWRRSRRSAHPLFDLINS